MKKLGRFQLDTPPTTDMKSSTISRWTKEARERGRVEETATEVSFVGKWEVCKVSKTPEVVYGENVYIAQVYLCDTPNF